MGQKKSVLIKLIGVIGSLCGIIATVFTIYAYYNPTSPSTQRYDSIVGSWLADYSYTVKGNTVRVNGKTTFFANGKYNFHGSISIASNPPDDPIFIDYLSDGSGDWQLYDRELLKSLSSLKTKPVKLVLNNRDFDPVKLEMVNNRNFPTIEEEMASGKTQAYKVVRATNNQLTVEVINELGKNFKFDMYKSE